MAESEERGEDRQRQGDAVEEALEELRRAEAAADPEPEDGDEIEEESGEAGGDAAPGWGSRSRAPYTRSANTTRERLSIRRR